MRTSGATAGTGYVSRSVWNASRVRPTVVIVDNIVATIFSLSPVIATTSPEHTLTARPGLTTLPRATIRSP